jgi:hypothetical protein
MSGGVAAPDTTSAPYSKEASSRREAPVAP